MPSESSHLERWWGQLSDEQRTEALQAHRSGEFTDSLQQSLSSAGVRFQRPQGTGQAFPSSVDTFLKTRHDT